MIRHLLQQGSSQASSKQKALPKSSSGFIVVGLHQPVRKGGEKELQVEALNPATPFVIKLPDMESRRTQEPQVVQTSLSSPRVPSLERQLRNVTVSCPSANHDGKLRAAAQGDISASQRHYILQHFKTVDLRLPQLWSAVGCTWAVRIANCFFGTTAPSSCRTVSRVEWPDQVRERGAQLGVGGRDI